MRHILLFDYKVFEFINSWAGRSRVFDVIAVFCARDLVLFLAAGLVLYWVFAKDRFMARKSLIEAFLSFVLARWVFVEAVRLFFYEDRPFVTRTVTELLTKGNEASFPSGHMSAIAAIAAAVYFYHPRLGAWLWVLAAIVGIARVVVGVHYPIDILGGAICGWVSAAVVHAWAERGLNRTAHSFSRLWDKIFSYK